MWGSDQGWNLRPLHWKSGVLTTGPPGKSLDFFKIERKHLLKYYMVPDTLTPPQKGLLNQTIRIQLTFKFDENTYLNDFNSF